MTPLVLLASPGCTETHDPTYHIMGSFTAEAAQADFDDLRLRVEKYEGADVLILESLPEQYQIRGLRQADCDDVRTLLETLAYVDSVGACLREQHEEETRPGY